MVRYFKWLDTLVRYLHPANHNPKRNRKVDKLYGDILDFKDIKFSVKVRDVHKIERKIPLELVFLVIKIRKNIQSMCQKKYCQDKNVDF